MTRLLTATVDDAVMEQIENLTRVTGKPEKMVIREVVKAGLKNYKNVHTRTTKALLEIADYAEEIGAKGPKDLSTNHNKYAWDE